ncbi:hypothetical protein N7490_001061 [Penicillium lividum]|nr:hypothetical protein N7490_001061 [Penicillium lividum]
MISNGSLNVTDNSSSHIPSHRSELSIAVNVFFRSLTKGYAADRDVYENRDLHACEKSRQDLRPLTPDL